MPKILATDLDGTFFYPKKRLTMLPRSYINLVRRWVDEGNVLIFITGRNLFGAKRAAKLINRKVTIICCNGSFIYDNKKKIFEACLEPSIIKRIIDVVDNRFTCLTYITFGEKHNMTLFIRRLRFWTHLFYPFWALSELQYFEPFIISKRGFFKSIDNEKVYKLMIVTGLFKKAKAYSSVVRNYIQDRFPEVEVAFSSGTIEITPSGRCKDRALLQYVESQKWNKDDVYVVGDSGNDIGLFKAFHEKSFCMAHSLQKIRKHAKYSIERFTDMEKYLFGEKEIKK